MKAVGHPAVSEPNMDMLGVAPAATGVPGGANNNPTPTDVNKAAK
jgi:hypothetical protein